MGVFPLLARPKKYDIDPKEVEKLAQFHCTNTEIASFFGCSPDLIEKSYSEYTRKGRDKGKIRLRKLMWEQAEKGNVVSQIFLSKNYVGMSDKMEQNFENLNPIELVSVKSMLDEAKG